MGTHSISLCMVVKNEGLLLRNCLETAGPLADEIIVVEDGSTDDTVEIARSFNAKIVPYPTARGWNSGYARNLSIQTAGGDFILVLDGDERISREDCLKLRALASAAGASAGYYLTCRDYTKRYNLLFNWRPNDGRYPLEEALSRCPGSYQYPILRFFRRAGAHFDEGPTAHTDPVRSLGGESAIAPSGVVIHHFQYLKGGEELLVRKQGERLESELEHLRLYPASKKPYLNAAISLLCLRREDEALACLENALSHHPGFREAHFLKALILKECDRWEEASETIHRAIQLAPENADAWALSGIIHEAQGNLREAEIGLDKALELSPNHLLARNCRGLVYFATGRQEEARAEFLAAIEIHPEFPDSRFNLGELCLARENWEDARRSFEAVLRIDPSDRDARERIAWLESKGY